MFNRRQVITSAAAAVLTAAGPAQANLGYGNETSGSGVIRDGQIRLTDGRCLGFRDYGANHTGPLIFYFHGTPGSRLELGLCRNEVMASEARVVSVDRPGMGQSSYCATRRITDWPNDIQQLAAALGYHDRQFSVIGLSGGAAYAAACAHQIPHRLTHAAIVSGHAPMNACGTRPGNQDRLLGLISRRPRLGRAGLNLVSRRLRRRPDRVIQTLSRNWSAADRRLIFGDRRIYCELIANLNEASRCGVTGMVRDAQLLARPWGFCLNQINGVSVSIWQGGCDPVVTPSMGRYFHRNIAGSEFRIDPGAGHVTMFKWRACEILKRCSQSGVAEPTAGPQRPA